jgi:AraC-like DNA-binding protein
MREAVALEDAGGGGEELLGGVEVWHARHPITRLLRRLERNGRAPRRGRIGGVDLRPGYREWAPPPPVRGVVRCVWARVVAPGAADVPVLPDACSDLIWQAGRGAFVAGPDTGPAPIGGGPGTVYVGLRFGPGAGGPALALPLSELRDRRVALADLDRRLDERLPADLEPREAVRRLLETVAAEPDAAVVEAARRLDDPGARIEGLAAELGLSERQLRRRCHAAAGYGPKTLHRVLRFRRFLAAPGGDLARAALDAGYADQSHLTRECGRLSGLAPAALLSARG